MLTYCWYSCTECVTAHSYITHSINSNAVSATTVPIKLEDLSHNPVYGATEPLEGGTMPYILKLNWYSPLIRINAVMKGMLRRWGEMDVEVKGGTM